MPARRHRTSDPSRQMAYTVRFSVLCTVALFTSGCSKGVSGGNTSLHVTADTLVGRWNVMPKGVADENPGAREVTAVAREKHKMTWDFKADHTCDMSVQAGLPTSSSPSLSSTTTFKWTARQNASGALTVDFGPTAGNSNAPSQAKVVFETK